MLLGFSFSDLLNPKHLFDSISPYGEIGLIAIIFAETGLLLGFFLPGDSLLFTAGLLASQDKLNLAAVLAGSFVEAATGGQVGYMLGKRVGPRLFARPNSKLFKQEYVERTKTYFDRQGPKTIVIARFVPIVRTFAPLLAGVAEMRLRTFFVFNVVGALIWAVCVSILGYWLGSEIHGIDRYLLPVIAAIVIVSAIPPFLEWRKHRRRSVGPKPPAEAVTETADLQADLERPYRRTADLLRVSRPESRLLT